MLGGAGEVGATGFQLVDKEAAPFACAPSLRAQPFLRPLSCAAVPISRPYSYCSARGYILLPPHHFLRRPPPPIAAHFLLLFAAAGTGVHAKAPMIMIGANGTFADAVPGNESPVIFRRGDT